MANNRIQADTKASAIYIGSKVAFWLFVQLIL